MRNEVSEDSGNGGTLTLLGSDYDLLATIESQERYYFITSPHQRDNFKVVYFSSPLRELLGLPETGQGPWSYHNFFAEENDNPVLDHLEQALLFGYEVSLLEVLHPQMRSRFTVTSLVLLVSSVTPSCGVEVTTLILSGVAFWLYPCPTNSENLPTGCSSFGCYRLNTHTPIVLLN